MVYCTIISYWHFDFFLGFVFAISLCLRTQVTIAFDVSMNIYGIQGASYSSSMNSKHWFKLKDGFFKYFSGCMAL